jgi:hypothetical protein
MSHSFVTDILQSGLLHPRLQVANVFVCKWPRFFQIAVEGGADLMQEHWGAKHLVISEGIAHRRISAKGRDKCPQFDATTLNSRRLAVLHMAWSVDRLGRSLQDLVAFLSESCTRFALTCSFISKASTPQHQPERPCSK